MKVAKTQQVKPEKRKMNMTFHLPHCGKSRLVSKTIIHRGAKKVVLVKIHISDETRRLRRIWVGNLLLRKLGVVKKPRV